MPAGRIGGRGAVALACLGMGLVLLGPWGGRGGPAAETLPSVDEVVDRVQETCAKVQDLSARFHQTAANRSLGQVQEASGLFLLKRPGKMRWEYQTPEPRLFITDGKKLWVFSPADKQVVIQDVGQALSSRIPLSFLAGDCGLRRDFQVGAVDNAATRASPASFILDLTPKRREGGVARVLLEVSLRTYTVEKTTLFDAYGNTTVIAFTNLKLNPGLADPQFEFTPPPDVTVVTPPSR